MNWFVGAKFNIWITFLLSNLEIIRPKNLIKIIFTSLLTLRNSLLARSDNSKIEEINFNEIKIIDPIFILGHWRSGTSLLHNILTNDDSYNYPNLLQVTFPNTFLTIQAKLKAKNISNKRPMDNMQVTNLSPGEEEVAVWSLCGISSIGNRLLTTREKYYDNFLTFENASESEIEKWKNSLIYFLRKITINDNRQLILKSPENTARVKILLELFPNAKFINIHRNPFNVFKSTLHLYDKVIRPSYYDLVTQEHLIERIITIYNKMYSSFFNDFKQIPNQNFADVSYEDLSKNTLTTIHNIYEALSLSMNQSTEKKMSQYINSINGYTKNLYPEIEQKIKNRIYIDWSKSFNYWSY